MVAILGLMPVMAFVRQPAVPQPRVAVRMSSSLLPDMYRERWAGDQSHHTRDATLQTKYNAAKYVGALLGASAVAAVGVGVSTMSTDTSISMLGAAGMFNEDVSCHPLVRHTYLPGSKRNAASGTEALMR